MDSDDVFKRKVLATVEVLLEEPEVLAFFKDRLRPRSTGITFTTEEPESGEGIMVYVNSHDHPIEPNRVFCFSSDQDPKVSEDFLEAVLLEWELQGIPKASYRWCIVTPSNSE